MAKQGNWNKSFWKRLDNLGKINEKQIIHIIQNELNKVETIMVEKTPFRYGGLLASHYAVLVQTEHGYSGRVGYTQTPHWDLDVSNPHQDDFTNPQLIEMLSEKPKTSANVLDINNAMIDFRENCRNKIRQYILNGGK